MRRLGLQAAVIMISRDIRNRIYISSGGIRTLVHGDGELREWGLLDGCHGESEYQASRCGNCESNRETADSAHPRRVDDLQDA